MKASAFLIVSFFVGICSSSRILGVTPTSSFSHHLVFRRLWKELSLRGHNVTVITPYPMKDPSLVNITEIDVHSVSKPIWDHHIGHMVKLGKRNYPKFLQQVMKLHSLYIDKQLNEPEVKKLLSNTSEPFDLVVVEFWHPIMYAFGKKFNSPVIGIGSMDANSYIYATVGSPNHPLLYRDFGAPFQETKPLGFAQRILSVAYQVYVMGLMEFYYPMLMNPLIKKHFGFEKCLSDVASGVNMIMINKSPILLTDVRPTVPAVVYFGGATHINNPNPLPKVGLQ